MLARLVLAPARSPLLRRGMAGGPAGVPRSDHKWRAGSPYNIGHKPCASLPTQPPATTERSWLTRRVRHSPRPLCSCSNMAIEKYAKYKEDYHLRFKWTPKRVRDTLIWGIGAPVFVYYLIKTEQV